MIIRDATNTDINGIVGLIKEYSYELPLECATGALSPQKVAFIATSAIGLGIAQIAVLEDDTVVGVAMGMVELNVWSMHAREISMLVLYVTPEHRVGTTGGRLFSAYLKATKRLMDERPDIQGSHVFEQPEGTNINYEKRGFKYLQSQFTQER